MKGTKFHNCYRAYRFTIKGKRIGCSKEWENFENFKNDMFSSYKEGLKLCRLNKQKPFSKDNCIWAENNKLSQYNKSIIKLTYNEQTKTIKEWSNDLNLSENGIKIRYHRCKDYTTEEILFGKQKKDYKPKKSIENLDEYEIKVKASKMISSYRIKDLRRFNVEHKLNVNWFINNILKNKCYYCKDTQNLGCDRLDNNKPHYIDNVVPCCFICNTARNNHFTPKEFKLIGEVIRQIKSRRNE